MTLGHLLQWATHSRAQTHRLWSLKSQVGRVQRCGETHVLRLRYSMIFPCCFSELEVTSFRAPLPDSHDFGFLHRFLKYANSCICFCCLLAGIAGRNTRIFTGDISGPRSLSATGNLVRFNILPTKASLENKRISQNDLFRTHILPYFQQSDEDRHVIGGDTLMLNGVQFKVLSTTPSNGIVTDATQMFSDGEPLADLTKAHILPIYETLPNSEKPGLRGQDGITERDIVERYLMPYFQGRFQHLVQGTGATFVNISCRDKH